MIYEMTMERTLRVAVKIEAEDDVSAEVKAEELFNHAILNPEEFESGYVRHDYALCDDKYRDIILWS